MPIKLYQCPICKLKREKFHLTKEDGDAPICETCHTAMVSIPASGSFILKGEGFYKPSKD